MHVWVKRSSCSRMASVTATEVLPTFRTAMPAPRSISWLPSTSRRIAPEAASTNTGVDEPSPPGTAARRRCSNAREFGPGISVASLRSCLISISVSLVLVDPRDRLCSRGSVPVSGGPGRTSPGLCTNRTIPGMSLTVGDLLRIRGLDLGLVAGSAGLGRPIRWVHVSELEDPTPWLKGGELLLTTGMGVGTTPARQRAYLSRLTEAGLAGVGFGTGFSFRKAPKGLVEAAEGAEFPLFEVPYPIPFIAITEAVFTRLVAEQYDLLSRSLEAEHTLTRAVLAGEGTEGIVGALTRATQGWAVLLDLHGAPIASVPSSAQAYVPILWSELQSPRAEGLPFSLDRKSTRLNSSHSSISYAVFC